MKKILFRRHGDVNFFPISKKEFENFKGKTIEHDGSYTVAHGEATGSTHDVHCHDMIVKEDGEDRVIAFLKTGKITHSHDHLPLTIPPKTYYRQVPEREIDHFSKTTRKVVD